MKIIFSIFFLLTFFQGFSQLKGVVYGNQTSSENNNKSNQREKLIGAKIKSLQTKTGVVAKEDGLFEIILSKNLPDTLVISAFGYYNDTLVVTKKDRFALVEINLYSDKLLPEVVASAKREGHGIFKLKILQVENIGEGELRKAACCNLSESFETNASVDVNITDAVSGAKKIQMMGLDGVYTQFQFENIPYLRGLESSYGLNSIPGTWIESIQITKGTGNVVNGYESMAGLINLELKKPENIEAFYFNFYGNRLGRAEVNLHGGGKVNSKLHGAWFAHAAGLQTQIDENKDGFRDLPLSKNLAFLNRWRYDGKKMEAQFGFNTNFEEKEGGQMNFDPRKTDTLFGVHIINRHIDAFAKTGFFFPKKPYQSIGIVYNIKFHQTEAKFGNRSFFGEEKRAYVNAIYDGIIGNTNHKIKSGMSLVYADVFQKLDSLELPRVEVVPGIYSEYTYSGTRFTYIAGARLDYHNLYGVQFSPRLHGKYSITENLDLRFTGGKGFRVSNMVIDNISLLATSRAWILDTIIKPEISWNFGGSIVQDFYIKGRKASLSFDYYHTLFENQLVVDRDKDHHSIYFTNLQGKSYSNSFQMEISLPILKNFDVRMALKYLDVKSELGGIIQQQVMIPRYRGFVNLAYFSRNKRWEYDFTTSIYGKSRLHDVSHVENYMDDKNESKVFPIMNAQITHIYKSWDFYLGGENIGNYRQVNPIVDVENPFGSNFDATRVWAPVLGINVYVGVRYKIKKKKKII
jgi:outer membrane receptor for ferrienterochelin and colicins